MKDPFEDIRARMKLLEEPLRAQRELSRQLGGPEFAAQTLERLETFRAVQAYEQERTASQLAAADFDAFGISKTYEEMERRHQALRLARETFDRLGSEEAARLRYLQDIRLFDRNIFERASLASEEVARMRDLFDRTAARAPLWQDALGAAEMAKELALPDRLEAFRASSELYALRLVHAGALDHWREPAFLSAFGESAAFADLLGQSGGATRELMAAGRELLLSPVPMLGSLAEYRQFLDGAGLTLPRIPRIRIVSRAEKRRRIRDRLKWNGAPPHVKHARTLVHKYELTLRESIDAAMAIAFGDDWAEQRLEACGCRDLLGRWRNRGGEPLDHADYAHYARIMCHPEHFEAAFADAFEDADELRELIGRARRLRAASHHPHKFTPEDLRELRLTWRTIEAGLAALVDDFEIDSWG